jgi:hypothetical protein
MTNVSRKRARRVRQPREYRGRQVDGQHPWRARLRKVLDGAPATKAKDEEQDR